MTTDAVIKVLMVDDDEVLTDSVKAYFLSEGGFSFTSKNDGESGAESAISEDYDVIILDVTMPKMNGFETLKYIRRKKDTPVIMLTARGDDLDRILGLEIGADDYVPKPCNLRELVARVRAIMRRVSVKSGAAEVEGYFITVGDLKLRSGSLTVEKNGVPILMTSAEFMILEKLTSMAGAVVSKDDISRHALGRRISAFDRSVDAHIVSLRKKLGPMPDGQQRIKTVRGRGYLYVSL
ncbi:response regulator transcription factor [Rheinheimera aquimaris]|uniref:Response regulator transcription factor n=1 Tax=Rheinheimera aquimaris TaxID=412437 RepID=A0ABN1DJK1_9GAMM|nr:response regulator [Rheinheimera aquimaris]MCB5212944.1 response regulator [Rheinheimera aquimaris]